MIKKHWLVLVKPALLPLGFFLIAGVVVDYYPALIFLFLAAIASLYFIYRIFAREFDIWVVTNLRVIDEYGVFSHNAKESPLDKINNVSYQQSLKGRIYNYGDVQIQTAAEMGATTFKFVTSPKLLKDTITKCQDEYKQSQIVEQAQRLAQAIKGDRKSEAGTKECPYCAEIIKAKAKICRFCGKELK